MPSPDEQDTREGPPSEFDWTPSARDRLERSRAEAIRKQRAGWKRNALMTLVAIVVLLLIWLARR